MKIVKPYINERKEIIFIEFKNESVEGLVNGFIFGLLILTPIFIILL